MKKWICLVMCVCLVGGIFSGCATRGDHIPNIDPTLFTVTPSAQTDGMIPPNAQFSITYSGGKGLSVQEIQKLFVLEPDTAFTVEKKGKTYLLKPEKSFEKDKIVNMKALDSRKNVIKSWAFQTLAGFRVVRSTPDNAASYVPPTNGIEIVLSHPNVTVEEFKKNFTLISASLEEPVEGDVEKFGDTMVFVPKQSLDTSCVYHAILSGALKTPDGETLGEDYDFEFSTMGVDGGKGQQNYFENASAISETFIPGDAPIIAVNCSDLYLGLTADVKFYQFKSGEDYKKVLDDLAQRRNGSSFGDTYQPKVDVNQLLQIESFQQVIASSSSDWGPKFIVLPGEYKAGWYYALVTITDPTDGKQRELQKLIQLSGVSAYSMQTAGKSLFWLNDAVAGEPLKDAAIKVSGVIQSAGTSAPDGTAVLEFTQDTEIPFQTGVLSIENAGNAYYDLYETQSKKSVTPEQQYVSYLYTDRPIYMSNDTIRVWGMIRPRAGVSGIPDDLQVVLGSYENDLYSVPITTAPDGTFTAEIPFEKLGGKDVSYMSVTLKYGEEKLLASVYVEIGDYVKPIYSPSLTFDKPVYWENEIAKLHFSATFFDNTPANNFSVNASFSERVEPANTTLTTGADGSAPLDIHFNPVPSNTIVSWRPEAISCYVSNANGENENFSIYNPVYVLRRDLALRGEIQKDGTTLKIMTNKVDTSKIKSMDDLWKDNNLIGESVDAAVTVELRKRYYTKTATGSYYDFLRKEKVTQYKYDRHDTIVRTEVCQTVNGVYEVLNVPKSTAQEYYYFALRAPDSTGKTVEEGVGTGYDSYYINSGIHRYNFLKDGVWQETDYKSAMQFEDQKTTDYKVMDNGEDVLQGRILYAVVQGDITDFAVAETPHVTLPFDEKLVPNYHLIGAIFDGKYIYPIETKSMLFNPGTRALNIEVKPEKESYAPGDTATIRIHATYPDGKPAAGAAVSLSLVDEAVFAIREQDAQPLDSIYRAVYNPSIELYYSYNQYNFSGEMAGEKGGGGGDGGIRSDFQDTAAFMSATTDAQGESQIEVKLPDNITSWRATAQAISEDFYVGAAKTPVVVTGTLFINEVLAQQYLTGDDATLTLRANGSGTKGSDMVDYTVLIEGPGDKTEQKASGQAKDFTTITLGKLQKGSYKITMTAKSGALQDSVEKTVQVVDSGVEVSMTQTVDLKNGLTVEPEKFPLTVGFFNADYHVYAQVLEHLLSNSAGSRTDERIAARYARDCMGFAFEEEDSFGDVLSTNGYVNLFPYDSYSLSLTARVHLAAPEYLLGGRPQEAFLNVLGSAFGNMETQEEERDSIALAYLGLAAHQEPVLAKIRVLLENASAFSEKGQLYLLAALAALGDTDGAAQHYEIMVTPKLAESTTGSGEKALYIDKGSDINENLAYTALASMVASMIRSEHANGLVRYLMSNRSTVDLYLLEEIIYLRYMQPQGGETASVSFKRAGKNETLNLKETGMQFVKFTSADFAQANVQVKKGNVWAQLSYVGNAKDAAAQDNKTIELVRTIEPVDATDFKPGGIVKITLTPKYAKDTIDPWQTTIDDYIPSGLRFIGMHDNSEESNGKGGVSDWWQISREGQRVRFYYDAAGMEEAMEEGPKPGEKTYTPISSLTYYARCATSGTYVVDSAFVRANGSPDWGMSEKAQITIDE